MCGPLSAEPTVRERSMLGSVVVSSWEEEVPDFVPVVVLTVVVTVVAVAFFSSQLWTHGIRKSMTPPKAIMAPDRKKPGSYEPL